MFNYLPKSNFLEHKTLLVTGAGDGIGQTAALHFAKYGAQVILLGRTVKKLEATYDDIVQRGYPTPAIVPMDLKGASESHYQGLAETIASQFQQLDGCLHNASVLGDIAPFEHISKASFDEVMQVNVTAQFQLTKALLPLLRHATPAHLLFTSSLVGRQGRAYWGAYAISKFATEGMMQVLADELENTNIRVNSINPGATKTAMRQKAYPDEPENIPQKPADLMPLYLYLFSEDALHLHGQAIDAKETANLKLAKKPQADKLDLSVPAT
jgi:NAD(P)-dependent dehydrogenase (short-subunit alcohol dehydrogenase family)